MIDILPVSLQQPEVENLNTLLIPKGHTHQNGFFVLPLSFKWLNLLLNRTTVCLRSSWHRLAMQTLFTSRQQPCDHGPYRCLTDFITQGETEAWSEGWDGVGSGDEVSLCWTGSGTEREGTGLWTSHRSSPTNTHQLFILGLCFQTNKQKKAFFFNPPCF